TPRGATTTEPEFTLRCQGESLSVVHRIKTPSRPFLGGKGSSKHASGAGRKTAIRRSTGHLIQVGTIASTRKVSTILIRLLRWPRSSGTVCRERNADEEGRCPQPFHRLFQEWTDGRTPDLSLTMGPDARCTRRDRPLDGERGAGASCRATDRDADGG